MSKIDKCPYGEKYRIFWKNRYQIFKEFDRVRVDAESLYATTPEELAADIATRTPGTSLLDVCCGVGGNSIAFANAGKNVQAFEIKAERIEMAKHNANIYGVSDRITFECGDISEICRTQKIKVDTLFLDPPWGKGPGDYLKNKNIYLENLKLSNTDLRDIVSAIDCKNVVMKLPKNFVFNTIALNCSEKLVNYTNFKNNSIFYCTFLTKKEFLATEITSPYPSPA